MFSSSQVLIQFLLMQHARCSSRGVHDLYGEFPKFVDMGLEILQLLLHSIQVLGDDITTRTLPHLLLLPTFSSRDVRGGRVRTRGGGFIIILVYLRVKGLIIQLRGIRAFRSLHLILHLITFSFLRVFLLLSNIVLSNNNLFHLGFASKLVGSSQGHTILRVRLD